LIDLAVLCSIDIADHDGIEKLLNAVFGTSRHGRTAYKLRAGTQAIGAMSFCIIGNDEALIGSIQCWPVKITSDDGPDFAMVLVGPVAVSPDWQNEGHGQMLMNAALEAAMLEGNPPMMLIGDAEYYARFGFAAAETGGWRLPGHWEAERLLLRNAGDYPLPATGLIGPDLRD
jgi:predicted N-acetyltransferase YhbS